MYGQSKILPQMESQIALGILKIVLKYLTLEMVTG